MKQFYGYIRVSTVKQGQQGVSLQEQKDAILRYAGKSGIKIIGWFEEQLTAAKHGRPIFMRMLKLLKQEKRKVLSCIRLTGEPETSKTGQAWQN